MLVTNWFFLTNLPSAASAISSMLPYRLDIQRGLKSLFGTSTFYSHFCGDMVNICNCFMLDKAPVLP